MTDDIPPIQVREPTTIVLNAEEVPVANIAMQMPAQEIVKAKVELSAMVQQLDFRDIEKLDVGKLREAMLKSMYVLEHCLYSQAASEYDRIQSMRALMGHLEISLFDKKTMDKLEPFQKIQMYRLISENLNNSLAFLQNLHKESATALDTINNIEKTKMERPVDKPPELIDRAKLADVKKLIEDKIKQRIQEKRNEQV